MGIDCAAAGYTVMTSYFHGAEAASRPKIYFIFIFIFFKEVGQAAGPRLGAVLSGAANFPTYLRDNPTPSANRGNKTRGESRVWPRSDEAKGAGGGDEICSWWASRWGKPRVSHEVASCRRVAFREAQGSSGGPCWRTSAPMFRSVGQSWN